MQPKKSVKKTTKKVTKRGGDDHCAHAPAVVEHVVSHVVAPHVCEAVDGGMKAKKGDFNGLSATNAISAHVEKKMKSAFPKTVYRKLASKLYHAAKSGPDDKNYKKTSEAAKSKFDKMSKGDVESDLKKFAADIAKKAKAKKAGK